MAHRKPDWKPAYLYHKDGCKCRPCQGKAKALLVPVGGPGLRDDPPPSEAGGPQGPILEPDLVEVYKGSTVRKSGGVLVRNDRSIRGRVQEWMAIRAMEPALTNIEIAERLGIAPRTLNNYLGIAAKEGWLVFHDPLARIEHEIVPAVVDNLAHFLKMKDKQVTIETAKGVIFPGYRDSKGISEGQNTILALKIETVASDQPVTISGNVVGRPRQLED